MLVQNFKQNEKGRDFVVGDLHGCHTQFEMFLDFINFDDTKDRMFSVGDLIDRGPDNIKCLDLLKNTWFHAVKGNHEDMMELVLDKKLPVSQWERNGGGWNREHSIETLEQLSEIVKKLPLVINVERRFHVIHAEMHGNGIIETDLESEFLVDEFNTPVEFFADAPLLWGRKFFGALHGEELNEHTIKKHVRRLELAGLTKTFKSVNRIYCGHTIMQNPTKISALINIDTGAFLTGERPWAGLTFTEPASGKFWKVTDDVNPVDLVTIL